MAGYVLNGGLSLQRKLEQLPKKIQNKIGRTALRDAAKLIQAEAKRLAPVHDGPYPPGKDRKPGSLRKAIKVRSGGRRKGMSIVKVTIGQGDFIGKTFYGAFLEYGHFLGKRKSNRSLGVKKGKRLTIAQRLELRKLNETRAWVEPRPFMRPAVDAKRKQAVNLITERINQLLRSEGKK